MSDANVQALLQAAIEHHRAGRVADAATIYEQVLATSPSNADALHLLGLAKHQSGSSDEGIALIQRAIANNPTSAEFHSNLAGIFVARKRIAEAADSIGRAAKLVPTDATFHLRHGKYLQKAGRRREAIDAYKAGLQLRPDAHEPTVNLAILLLDEGKLTEAKPLLEAAVQRRPDSAEAVANLGLICSRMKRHAEAVKFGEQALKLDPNLAEVYTNLGGSYLALGQPAKAADTHRRALELRPGWTPAKTNLAIALMQLDQVDEALALHEEVLRELPEDANSLFNRGTIRLSRGDFLGGWRDYEARFRVPELPGQQTFPQLQWSGQDPAGKTILVHAEQGLGDAIQFVRYVPELVSRSAKVILQCDPALLRLLKQSFPDVNVVKRGEPLPPFDFHVPIMSFPFAFGTMLESIPATTPYLHASQISNSKLSEGDHAVRVGLVWAGNPEHYNDRNRSIPLAKLLPSLAAVAGVRLFSLQKGSGSSQLAECSANAKIVDLAPDFTDLADTAAAIKMLDVVICVDTSIAHLAGAIGANVWTLIPKPADFRWMIDRDDSPWYPTMRLFRQLRSGQWDDVLQRVADELRVFTQRALPEEPRRTS